MSTNLLAEAKTRKARSLKGGLGKSSSHLFTMPAVEPAVDVTDDIKPVPQPEPDHMKPGPKPEPKPKPEPVPTVVTTPEPTVAPEITFLDPDTTANKIAAAVAVALWVMAALIPISLLAAAILGLVPLLAAGAGILFYLCAARTVIETVRRVVVIAVSSRTVLRVAAVVGLGTLLIFSQGQAWALCTGGAVLYLFAEHMLGTRRS